MKISTKIFIAFTVILVLSVLNTVSNFILSEKVKQNSDFLSSSQEIIRNSGQFQRAVLEMQSSFRGFLLSNDSTFLSGYHQGLKEVPQIVMEMEALVQVEPAQSRILDSINGLHAQWIGYARNIIEAKSKVNLEPTNKEFTNLFESSFKRQTGKKLNDRIAANFILLNGIEYKARQIHSLNLARSIKKTKFYSGIFIGMTIIIGAGMILYVMRTVSRRIRSMVKLAESISKGNFTIIHDNNHDELTSLSLSMNIMSSNLNKSITQLQFRNAELDKFAYVVSHDLKAPLRGIYNVIKWIQEDFGHELSAKMTEFLQIIANRTVKMERLINGLLEYARLRTQALSGPTDIHSVVKDLVQDLVPNMYQVEVGPLPTMTTERLKLEQVFSNLISNAVKYTAPHNGQIHISGTNQGDHFEFTVKDNGIGIDPLYHERIFEIFQTLREKDDEESTGIGLSIVKKILDEHQETIHVTSSPGNGSAFTFTWHPTNN